MSSMKRDFQRWSTLPLSLAGRIQSLKMNILPKFLFLFQCLPVFLPKFFFKTLDTAIIHFVWNGKIPRVGKLTLQRPKDQGGLALPNFLFYYFAANIYKISFWINAPDINWCVLESLSCHSSSLKALIFSSLPLSPTRHSSNPLVIATLKIWIQFRRMFGFLSASTLIPIVNNHLFTPSRLDHTFSSWNRLGIATFRDLYDVDDTFYSFSGLCSKFHISRTNMF